MADNAGTLARSGVDLFLNTAQFDRAIGSVRNQLQVLSSRRINLGLSPGSLIAGLGIAAIGAGIDKIAEASSSLVEARNKAAVTFNQGFAKVSTFADQLADKFGIVKSETLDAAANFGAFAQGMGLAETASADFATKFVKLALDLKSFNNLGTVQEALVKLQASLVGETEPLARLGVDLHEVTVKNFALAKGIAKVGVEMTQRQKVMARAALIEDRLGKVSGDLDRTIGDYANASMAAAGRTENFAAAIGESLMPAFTEFRALQNEVLIDLTTKTGEGKSAIEEFADAVKEKIQGLASVYRNWGLYVERTQLGVGGAFVNIGERLQWLGDLSGTLFSAMGQNWLKTLEFMGKATAAWAVNTGNRIRWVIGLVNPALMVADAMRGGNGKADAVKPPDPKDFGLKLPEFKPTDFAPLIEGIDAKIAVVDDAVKAARVPGAKPPIKPLDTIPEPGQKTKSGFSGLEEFAKKLQTEVTPKQDRVQNGILAAGQQAARGIDRLVAINNRPAPAVAVGPP